MFFNITSKNQDYAKCELSTNKDLNELVKVKIHVSQNEVFHIRLLGMLGNA